MDELKEAIERLRKSLKKADDSQGHISVLSALSSFQDSAREVLAAYAAGQPASDPNADFKLALSKMTRLICQDSTPHALRQACLLATQALRKKLGKTSGAVFTAQQASNAVAQIEAMRSREQENEKSFISMGVDEVEIEATRSDIRACTAALAALQEFLGDAHPSYNMSFQIFDAARAVAITETAREKLAEAIKAVERFAETQEADPPPNGDWTSTASVNRSVRNIDVALNGTSAAKQAALIDIEVHMVQLQKKIGMPIVDAALRYHAIRNMHWNESPYCVVDSPKKNVKLGAYCPSGERLDRILDTILKG